MTELAQTRPTKPASAAVHTFEVRTAVRLSPGFVRVTLRSTGDGFEDEFEPLGHDQWFRLFLPTTAPSTDVPLVLPTGPAEGWYGRLQAMPEGVRPLVRNYTVREARRADWPTGTRWDLDVDLVVHASPTTGLPDGAAARWALDAVAGYRLGEQVGVLDQGRIFAAEDHPGPLLVVADESGLPGVEGIARSLAAAGRTDVTYLLEVPAEADRRPLPAGAPVVWVTREFTGHGRPPGAALLDTLAQFTIAPTAAVYAVGEATLALGARRLARAAGVPDEHIDFCSYWRATH